MFQAMLFEERFLTGSDHEFLAAILAGNGGHDLLTVGLLGCPGLFFACAAAVGAFIEQLPAVQSTLQNGRGAVGELLSAGLADMLQATHFLLALLQQLPAVRAQVRQSKPALLKEFLAADGDNEAPVAGAGLCHLVLTLQFLGRFVLQFLAGTFPAQDDTVIRRRKRFVALAAVLHDGLGFRHFMCLL